MKGVAGVLGSQVSFEFLSELRSVRWVEFETCGAWEIRGKGCCVRFQIRGHGLMFRCAGFA